VLSISYRSGEGGGGRGVQSVVSGQRSSWDGGHGGQLVSI